MWGVWRSEAPEDLRALLKGSDFIQTPSRRVLLSHGLCGENVGGNTKDERERMRNW